jgi:hypothetical protein
MNTRRRRMRSGGSGQLEWRRCRRKKRRRREEGVSPSRGERPGSLLTSSIFSRGDSSEPECLGDTPTLSYVGASEEDRWWSPEPPQATSEEDEEEVQYLMHVLGLEPPGGQTSPSINSATRKAEAGSREAAAMPRVSRRKGPEPPRGTKRRKPRGKAAKSRDRDWEQARQDAWLTH